MAALEAVDAAAALLDDATLFPPLPDDLDDLFTEDLLQFLATAELGCTAGACPAAGPQPTTAAPPAQPLVPVTRPASSADEGSTGGASSCHSDGSSSPFKASASAAQQLQDPALPRLVVTTQAGPSGQSNHKRSSSCAGNTTTSCGLRLSAGSPTGTSRQASGTMDSSGFSSDTDEEMDTEDGCEPCCGKGTSNKRKAPEVDWRAIEDPAERRRQRRLAKNRVTAARSRERKKMQWSEMEAKLQSVETENLQLRAMLEQFARENSSLKQQLMSLAARSGGSITGGANAAACQASLDSLRGSSTEPAVLILIATLLVLCCILPGDKGLALVGSALPVMLAAQLLRGGARAAAAAGEHEGAFDALFRLLHGLVTLLQRSGRALQRSMHRLLFARQHICGQDVMHKLSQAAEDAAAAQRPQQHDAYAAWSPASCTAGIQPFFAAAAPACKVDLACGEPPLDFSGSLANGGCDVFAHVAIKPEPVY